MKGIAVVIFSVIFGVFVGSAVYFLTEKSTESVLAGLAAWCFGLLLFIIKIEK